ncbi:MAG: hypothetical protein H6741_13675 [Alphaproteobacteria bacterium]|nr:hypothetical protein [Alphaproteobacteria bacterium]
MNELDRVDTLDMVVALSPEAVAEQVSAALPAVPAPGRRTYRLRRTAEGFVVRRSFTRNGLRPALTVTLEPSAGGTRVQGVAALPSYARPLGRLVSVASVLMGAVMALALATQGQPADMPQEMWWFFWAAAAWMPVVGVLLPGMLVNQSLSQRAELIQVVQQALGSTQASPASESVGESAEARARRAAAARKQRH